MNIRVSYLEIAIVFVELEHYGEWSEKAQTIWIDKRLNGPECVSTLLHELCHACYSLHHPKGEEAICNAFGNFIAEALQRNSNLRKLIEENWK